MENYTKGEFLDNGQKQQRLSSKKIAFVVFTMSHLKYGFENKVQKKMKNDTYSSIINYESISYTFF
jgi:hypothetical protein